MLGSTSSSNNEYTKKLTIMLSGAVGAFAGMEKFRAAFAEIDKLQKGTAVSAAKAAKEAQAAESKALREREAARKQLAVLESRLDMEELKRRQFVESGKVTAAERSTLRIEQLNDARVLSEKRANDAILAGQAAANRRSLAQQKQHSAALRGLIAGGLSTAGTGLIAGGAGILAGGYGLVNSAMNWQSFVSQQLANSPMSGAQARQLQSIALRQAAATGASPQDILLAGRYGIERGLPMGLTMQTLNAAEMLGLPSGGTQQLAPSMQAIITAMKNNPTLMKNPGLVAGMILTAAQNSAGTTVPQFVNAIPQTLTMAGHFGVKNFPDVLAAIASMTQAGVPIEEANTGIYNLLARIATPSPGVQKILARLKNYGINLTGDFGSQALQDKGLTGILTDLRNAHLSPTTLAQLFPRLRAFLPALGLTGNYNQSYLNTQAKIASGQGQTALQQNYSRYLGLSSTQAAKLQRTFQALAITLGTALIPGFIALEKQLIPLARNFSAFVKQHKDLLVELMRLAPYMIGFGLALKGLALTFRIGGALMKGIYLGQKALELLGLTSKATAGAQGIGALSTATKELGITSEAAAGAAGVGGLSGAIKTLGAAAMVAIPWIAAAYQLLVRGPQQAQANSQSQFAPGTPIDQLWPTTGHPLVWDRHGNTGTALGPDSQKVPVVKVNGQWVTATPINKSGGATGTYGPPAPSTSMVPKGTSGYTSLTPWEQQNWGLITSLSAKYGVPVSIIIGMLSVESSGGMNSSIGAYGIPATQNPAQIDPSSGLPMPTSPQQSLIMGVQMLSRNYASTGNWNGALQMYNSGSAYGAPGYAASALGAGGGDTGGGFTLPPAAAATKGPHTPSGWSTYWSGKAEKDKKVLSELVGPYTDPKTGKINWKAMPKAVRQAADALINQIAGEEFMSGRGTLNADVSNPKVRGPLISQLWHDTVGARVHPEGWWDTTGGVLGKMPKSSTAGSTAVGHVVPVHIIGRCKAEEANRKHLAGTHGVSKATLHEIKTTGQRLDHIATILISIDRSVRGGDRVTRPAPRQGSYVAPIIHSR